MKFHSVSSVPPYTDRGRSRLYVALLSLRPYGPRSRAHITPFYARSYKTVPSTDTSSKPTFTTIYPQSSDIQYESTVIVHRVRWAKAPQPPPPQSTVLAKKSLNLLLDGTHERCTPFKKCSPHDQEDQEGAQTAARRPKKSRVLRMRS